MTGPGPGPVTGPRDRGWWRRNWWGLAAVVPAVAGAVLLHPAEPYQSWWSAQPRQPAAAEASEWVGFAGARLQLVELVPVPPSELADGLGEPVALPSGVRVWQAMVVVEGLPDPEALTGCEYRLEDERGRLFGNAPSELAGVALPGDGVDGQCAPFSDEGDGGGGAAADGFQTVLRFVLPATSGPVALRVTALEQMPRYVRFEVG